MPTQTAGANAPPPPSWPYDLLDVAALRAGGWRPTPFREFVLKVHQRCNLACDYCYVYTMADQTWRDRPTVMSPEVWQATAMRIAEHARSHGLTEVRVILHGGEPLLAGPERLLSLVADVRSALPLSCRAEFCLQTNGVLLTESVLRMLQESSILIGVSVDGTAADNDRHRHRADGRGSYPAVRDALNLLAEDRHRSAYAGVLCVVDPDTDPVGCYEALLRYAPPTMDFLLPHANWASPPRRHPDAGATPHGDWLVAVFDRWYDAPREETALARDLNRDLTGALTRARVLAYELGLHLADSRQHVTPNRETPPVGREPGRVCRQLVKGATWMLPASYRSRWLEEHQAELWDLGGLPGRRQLAHALRVVGRCWSLRRSLTAPAPKVSAGAGTDV